MFKTVRKDSIDSKSNALLHKQQNPKRIFSVWIMLVFDISHSEEDCYWQDIICKRKSERQRAPEMAEQVCTYLPALRGILTERREYKNNQSWSNHRRFGMGIYPT